MKRSIQTIRTKLLLIISVILFLSLLLIMGGIYLFQKDAMSRQAENNVQAISSYLGTGLKYQMLSRNAELLQSMIDEIKSSNNVKSALIINADGIVKFSSNPQQIGTKLDKGTDECQECHNKQLNMKNRQLLPRMIKNNAILKSCTPIYNEARCFGCHSSKQKVLGMLSVQYSNEDTNALIATTIFRLFITALSVFIILCLSIFYFTNRWINKPINILLRGTEEIQAGHYEKQIKYRSNDEFRVLAESFNDMSSSIINNIADIRNKSFELSFLYTIVKKVSESIYVEELKVIVIDLLLDTLNCEKCLIITPAGEPDTFSMLTKVKEGASAPSVIKCSQFASIGELKEYHAADPFKKWFSKGLNCPELSENSLCGYIPLSVRNKQLGLIIAVRKADAPFDEESFRLLNAVKEHIAVAFENARLYTLAITDQLTQLFTVRYFQTQMETEVSKYKRYGLKYSMLMMDIDKFKSVNDTYGHPSGDVVLKEVAAVIRNSLRDIDIPCRYGGEEFSVILPETSDTAGQIVAERIRANIEQKIIQLPDGQRISATMSIGGSSCPQNGTEAKDIVSIADKALYSAKETGRNKVVWGLS